MRRLMPEVEPEYLLKQARKCRSLSSSTKDEKLARTLAGMADEYEQKAKRLLDDKAKD